MIVRRRPDQSTDSPSGDADPNATAPGHRHRPGGTRGGPVNKEWGLLLGHHRGPRTGHQWDYLMATDTWTPSGHGERWDHPQRPGARPWVNVRGRPGGAPARRLPTVSPAKLSERGTIPRSSHASWPIAATTEFWHPQGRRPGVSEMTVDRKVVDGRARHVDDNDARRRDGRLAERGIDGAQTSSDDRSLRSGGLHL